MNFQFDVMMMMMMMMKNQGFVCKVINFQLLIFVI